MTYDELHTCTDLISPCHGCAVEEMQDNFCDMNKLVKKLESTVDKIEDSEAFYKAIYDIQLQIKEIKEISEENQEVFQEFFTTLNKNIGGFKNDFLN